MTRTNRGRDQPPHHADRKVPRDLDMRLRGPAPGSGAEPRASVGSFHILQDVRAVPPADDPENVPGGPPFRPAAHHDVRRARHHRVAVGRMDVVADAAIQVQVLRANPVDPGRTVSSTFTTIIAVRSPALRPWAGRRPTPVLMAAQRLERDRHWSPEGCPRTEDT